LKEQQLYQISYVLEMTKFVVVVVVFFPVSYWIGIFP